MVVRAIERAPDDIAIRKLLGENNVSNNYDKYLHVYYCDTCEILFMNEQTCFNCGDKWQQQH